MRVRGTWGRRKKHVDDHLLTDVMEWDKTTGYGWTQCLGTDSGLLYNPHIECRLSQIDQRLSLQACALSNWIYLGTLVGNIIKLCSSHIPRPVLDVTKAVDAAHPELTRLCL